MYAVVKITGDKGRALEAYARSIDRPPADIIASILEARLTPDQFPVPPKEDPGEGLDRMTRTYIKMRETKAGITRDADKAAAEIKEQMEKIEGLLLGKLNADGVQSMRTDSATFYKEEELKPSCADWGVFYNFVKDNDAFEFLERRVSKAPVEAYMKDKGEPPPGLNVLKEYKVRIRRGANT